MAPGPRTRYFILLVVSRELLANKRKPDGKDKRVNHDGAHAGLTRHKDTVASWGEGEEHTWAEEDKEDGGHDEVSGGQHQLEEAGHDAIQDQEHKCVEEDGRLGG